MNHKKKWHLTVCNLFLVISFVFLFSNCASSPKAKTETKQDDTLTQRQELERLEKSNIISPGFKISVHHSADDDINGDYDVGFNGEIKLPYNVTVYAAGLTPEELKTKITSEFSKFFKTNNQVRVEIVKREPLIEVRGIIQKPGRYLIRFDSNLEEIISLAGGFSAPSVQGATKETVQPEYLKIIKTDYKNLNASKKITWVSILDYFNNPNTYTKFFEGGEQLIFQKSADAEAIKAMKNMGIQIIGEVHNPGNLAYQPGADIFSYITQAGGLTSTAFLDEVEITNRNTDRRKTINLSDDGTRVTLNPGDVVLIRALQIRQNGLERTLPIILSVTSILTSALILFLAL